MTEPIATHGPAPAVGGPGPRVADPRVAEALAKIAASAGVDLNETPGVFDDVYRRLQSALAHPDQT